MKRNIVLFSIVLLMAWICIAQAPENTEEGKAGDPGASEDTAMIPGEEDAAPEEEMTPLEGDVVVFKKGSELRGVKVVRQSPMFVEIEYLPGEPYLKIPRTQVKEVIYAAKDEEGGQTDTEGLTLGPDIMPGEEVSPEFNRMLTSVVSAEPLTYENGDYLEVVRTLTAKAGVEIDVDENLTALSPEQRKFSHVVPGGTTLLDFLRKDLVEIAPDMRVILRYDRLALQKRVAVPEMPANIPPPEAPSTEQTPAVPEPPSSTEAAPIPVVPENQ